MSTNSLAKRTAAGTLALAVCLGGGAIALASAASADANFKFDTRIQGDDRYGTAVAASKAAFDKADNVILVNGYATVDGLTASYLAGVANAPILYVSDKGADDQTKAEIKRLGAKNIWLIGGEKVIPASVADAIKGDGYNVQRINGSDRYETAKLIAAKGTELSGKKPSKVFVASGTSFADALAVSPIAFVKGYPIALTEKDSTSQFTKDELGAIGTDSKILVGGEAVVSKKVQADLSIKDEQRVAGSDRAVTANLVSDWAKKSEGFNPANAALVGGTNGNGADSLVASGLLGKSFTTLHFAGWDATYVYLKDHANELTGKGFVFGGKAAVPGDQVDKAQAAAAVGATATAADQAPRILSASITGANQATLAMSEVVSLDGAGTPWDSFKYYPNGVVAGSSVSATGATVSGDGKSLVVTFASALTGSAPVISYTDLAFGTDGRDVRNAKGVTMSSDTLAFKDTFAPLAPAVAVPSTLIYLNAASTVISGTAETGSTVKLLNTATTPATVVASQVASGGNYNFSSVALTDDTDFHFVVTATDLSGNVSLQGVVPVIHEDSTAPIVQTGGTASPAAPLDTATSVSTGVTPTSPRFSEALLAGGSGATAVLTNTTDGLNVTGTVSLSDSGKKIVFTPTSTLTASKSYSITFTPKDLAGNVGATVTITFAT